MSNVRICRCPPHDHGPLTLATAHTISIVDDDASFRKAIANFVRSLGYAVWAFESAEEFLNSDRLDETQCVISDVRMPGMSGIELQSHLLAKGLRLPIIFVAVNPTARARERALAHGALDFLSKPFPEERLISLLDQAFKGRHV